MITILPVHGGDELRAAGAAVRHRRIARLLTRAERGGKSLFDGLRFGPSIMRGSRQFSPKSEAYRHYQVEGEERASRSADVSGTIIGRKDGLEFEWPQPFAKRRCQLNSKHEYAASCTRSSMSQIKWLKTRIFQNTW
jgi:hypothetical protein